jgi:uncharacterized NAD-dependent epimerase/dehydratase family protein
MEDRVLHNEKLWEKVEKYDTQIAIISTKVNYIKMSISEIKTCLEKLSSKIDLLAMKPVERYENLKMGIALSFVGLGVAIVAAYFGFQK